MEAFSTQPPKTHYHTRPPQLGSTCARRDLHQALPESENDDVILNGVILSPAQPDEGSRVDKPAVCVEARGLNFGNTDARRCFEDDLPPETWHPIPAPTSFLPPAELQMADAGEQLHPLRGQPPHWRARALLPGCISQNPGSDAASLPYARAFAG